MAGNPCCRVYNNANIAVSHNVLTAMTFNTERFDNDGMHDLVSNTGRITFNTPGIYEVSFSFELTSTSDYQHIFGCIRLTGTTHIASDNSGSLLDSTIAVTKTITTPYKFAAADWIDAAVIYKRVSAGASDVLVTGNRSPEFSAIWIGSGT